MREIFVLYLTGTPQHKPHYGREVEIRTTLQELLLYLIFLVNLCICKYTDVDDNSIWTKKLRGDEKQNMGFIKP